MITRRASAAAAEVCIDIFKATQDLTDAYNYKSQVLKTQALVFCVVVADVVVCAVFSLYAVIALLTTFDCNYNLVYNPDLMCLADRY